MGNLVKILTGRKLSLKKMQQAKVGHKKNFPVEMYFEFNTRDFRDLYKEEDKYIQRYAVYKMPKKDCSSCAHSNCGVISSSLGRIVEKKYDEEGFLVEKIIQGFEGFNGEEKIFVYNPAGSFFGRRK